MFWLGIYTMAYLVVELVVVVTKSSPMRVEYTGTFRLVSILMNLPILWFVYTAWGMYR